VLFGALALVSLATRVYLAQVSTGELPVTAPGFNFWYLYFLPTTHLYLFLAGVLLRKMVERLSDWRSRLKAPLATALLLISGAFLMMFPYLGKRQSEVLQSPLAMLVDLMVIAFFTAALLGSPLLSRLLGFRLLRFVGMISYSLFLLNETVLLLAAWFLFPDVGLWLVGRDELVVWAAFFAYMLGILVYSITISYLSFRYIESPFLRYKPK
jgi:peptidoglycan/LPS O-acetylase OafA/YrhL